MGRFESKLTSKGQTTIPKEVRDALHLKAGDAISYVVRPDGGIELRAAAESFLAGLDRLRATLPRRKGPPLSIEEMNEAMGRHVAADNERILRDRTGHQRRPKARAR